MWEVLRGADGLPGTDGQDGTDGAPGPAGADGLNCYDHPGVQDANGDGVMNLDDCVAASADDCPVYDMLREEFAVAASFHPSGTTDLADRCIVGQGSGVSFYFSSGDFRTCEPAYFVYWNFNIGDINNKMISTYSEVKKCAAAIASIQCPIFVSTDPSFSEGPLNSDQP